MSLVYILSKFSHEALVIETFLICLLCFLFFGYVILKRRRYGVAKNNISDQVVRAFLVELLSLSESFKLQLFGDTLSTQGGASFQASKLLDSGAGLSAAQLGELNSAKTQLASISQKNDDLNKQINQLKAEKAALEEKLKNAGNGSAAPAPAAAAPVDESKLKAELEEAKKKIAALEARLAEYEVIEDDLANLKRFQQENKQLKAEIEALKKGGAVAAPAPAQIPEPPAAAAPPPPPPAPEPVAAAPTPPPAPEPVAAAPAPAPAPVAEAAPVPVAEAAPPPAPKEAPAGASVADPEKPAAPAAPAEAAPPAVEAAADAKSDADLLSEFEKMLSN